MPQPHQLAAIMFTDIVGYTRIMGEDEDKALQMLRKNRTLHKSIIKKHRGKWLKEMGDGTLARFNTTSDAVYCGGELIRACTNEKITLRIGIHQGEVTTENGDIFGDGVNVASRIEPLAESGQILVSAPVHRNIKNKGGIKSTFVKEVALKNVTEPIKIYSVDFDPDFNFEAHSIKPHANKNLYYGISLLLAIILISYFVIRNTGLNNAHSRVSISDQIGHISSLAVLPFDNLTGDSTQNPLVAGMHDDLITVLSKIKSLDVISRTSTLSYKNRGNKSLKQIADELGVDAVIEASVNKIVDTVRINVQLIQPFPKEKHLWAEIFDRPFQNVLFLYDDVARAVSNEVSRALSDNKPPLSSVPKEINPEAYKAFMNGKFLAENVPTIERLEQALEYFQRSIELDSTYAPAYAGVSWVWISFLQLHHASGSEAIPKIYAYNSKALELDPNYPDAQYHKAVISFQDEWDWEKSEKAFLKALELNPNHAMAHAHYSHLLMYQQRFDEAIPHMDAAVKLDPLSPHVLGLCAIVYWHMGNFEKALDLTGRSPDTFGKNAIEESYAYLNGDFDASMNLLEFRFGADTLLFNSVKKEYRENSYQAAMKKLAENLENSENQPSAVFLALFYNRAGMTNDAIRVLENGYRNHDPNMPYVFVPIEFKNLESDPRYVALANKMKLPV